MRIFFIVMWFSSETLLAQQSQQISPAEALLKARAAYEHSDIKASAKYYDAIPYRSAEWQEKLIDGIRMHLTQGNFLDAWRISELSKRVRVTFDHQNYYLKIAALLAGACAVSITVAEVTWDELLWAYFYRNGQNFEEHGFEMNPYDVASAGAIQSHLPSAMQHYLSDIPKATLHKRKGCQWGHIKLSNKNLRAQNELMHLRNYYDSGIHDPTKKILGFERIEMRILALEKLLNREQLTAEILAHYHKFTKTQWLELEENDRRFIWDLLIAKQIFPKVVETNNPLIETITAIIYANKTPEVSYWLALVDFDRWANSAKMQLYEHLLAIDGLPNYQKVLVRKAHLLYQQGNFIEGLGLIRRLLVGNEAGDDAEVIDSATAIALDLFKEYKFDETILGAIQAALPGTKWHEMFSLMLYEQAVFGNVKGYNFLLRYMKTHKSNRHVLQSKELENILTALARRDFSRFKVQFSELSNKRILGSKAFRMMTVLASGVLKLKDHERRDLSPYFEIIARYLRRSPKFQINQEQTLALLNIFESYDQSAWSKGSHTVQEGHSLVGAIQLGMRQQLAYPYLYKAQEYKLTHNLVVMPHQATDRGWMIE